MNISHFWGVINHCQKTKTHFQLKVIYVFSFKEYREQHCDDSNCDITCEVNVTSCRKPAGLHNGRELEPPPPQSESSIYILETQPVI